MNPQAHLMESIYASFAHLTNPERMMVLLQAKLPEAWLQGRTIKECIITDSRLKVYEKDASWDKSTLAVCYELTMSQSHVSDASSRGFGGNGETTEIVYGRSFLNGRSQKAWAGALTDAGTDRAQQPQHVALLAEEELILWRFPADPAMPHLSQLLDSARLGSSIPWHQLARHSEGQRASEQRRITTRLLKYRPEIRCTIQVDIGREPTEARGSDAANSVIAKTFVGDEGETQYMWMKQLVRNASLPMPEPIAYSPEMKTLWLSNIAGVSLREQLTRERASFYLVQIGRGLATLHQSDFLGLDLLTTADLMAELDKKVKKLGRACPTVIDQLTKISLSAALAEEQLAPALPRVIHGDCHVEQFMVQDETVVFLDFDDLIWGDPEQDLAEFIVALLFYGYELADVTIMATLLIDAYQEHAPWPLQPKRLQWHAIYEYFNRAYRTYQEQRPGWAGNLKKWLDDMGLIERILP